MLAHHYRGAVSYAVRAAEVGGKAGPCCSLASFKLLLEGYVGLIDVEGIRWVVATALSSNYREKAACIRQLKYAKIMLRGKLASAAWQRARILEGIGILDQAIDQAKSFRDELAVEREDLEDEVMQILKQAARDADATVELDKMIWKERPLTTRHENAGIEELGVEGLVERSQARGRASDNLETGISEVDDARVELLGTPDRDFSPLGLSVGKRRFEVKVRSKKAIQGSSPHVAGNQTDDTLSMQLEKARFEENARNARKVGAVGW